MRILTYQKRFRHFKIQHLTIESLSNHWQRNMKYSLAWLMEIETYLSTGPQKKQTKTLVKIKAIKKPLCSPKGYMHSQAKDTTGLW